MTTQLQIQEVIVRILSQKKAYDLPSACELVGLDPGDEIEASSSKSRYIRRRLEGKSYDFLLSIARKIVMQYPYQSDDLESLLESHISSKVFVSYSHDSLTHIQRVRAFCDQLRSDGINAIIDQYFEPPSEGWPRWMEQNISESRFVLMVCSEFYTRRVTEPEPTASGHGVRWEGSLVYQYLYAEGTVNNRFIPVIFDQADAKYIPPLVSSYTYYCVGAEEGYLNLYRKITGQPETVRPALGRVRKLDIKNKDLLCGISVFLCHSSKDKSKVRELYRKLTLNGARPWLDEEDLLPGQKWEIEIPKAVRACNAIIVCLSSNSVTRTGYFHKEISFALDVLDLLPENAIYLIPVKFDDCDVPDRLRHLHYVSITDEKGYDKLLRSLLARAHQLQLGSSANENA